MLTHENTSEELQYHNRSAKKLYGNGAALEALSQDQINAIAAHEVQNELNAMSDKTLRAVRSYSSLAPFGQELIKRSEKYGPLAKVAVKLGVWVGGAAFVTACLGISSENVDATLDVAEMTFDANVRTELAPQIAAGQAAQETLNVPDTETPLPSDTPIPSDTPDLVLTQDAAYNFGRIDGLTAAAPTATGTATNVPDLGGIAGCSPLSMDRLDEFAPVDASGQVIANDQHDAWKLLGPNLLATDNNTVESLQCFTLQAENAYSSGLFQEGHITTFEKWAEVMGIAPSELINGGISDLSSFWLRDDAFGFAGIFREHLATQKLVGVATPAEHLSQTFVQLSEQLVLHGRGVVGVDGEVVSADQIARQLVNTYKLEGLWRHAIDPRLVDEIRQNCMTYRPDGPDHDRLNQPEGTVFVRHEDHIEPGQEKLVGNVYELSNQDGILVTLRVFKDAEELTNAQEILDENQHYATLIHVADGVDAMVQVFDLSNKLPNNQPVLDAANAINVGSGNQLEPCAVNPVTGSVVPATPTAPAVATRPHVPPPGEESTPVKDTPTSPAPSGTPPLPSNTPKPTDTQPVPTSTFAPSQVPQPTVTLGPTSTYLPPTPSWTPAPEITESTPFASSTPVIVPPTPPIPFIGR